MGVRLHKWVQRPGSDPTHSHLFQRLHHHQYHNLELILRNRGIITWQGGSDLHHLVSSTSDQLMVSTPLAISSICPKFFEHGNLVLCSKCNSFKTGFNIKCEPWDRMHICAYCPAGFNMPPPTFAVHTSTH